MCVVLKENILKKEFSLVIILKHFISAQSRYKKLHLSPRALVRIFTSFQLIFVRTIFHPLKQTTVISRIVVRKNGPFPVKTWEKQHALVGENCHSMKFMSFFISDEIEVAVNMQRLFEDLLYQYKVDLCLWAHVHSYERTCKLYKNMCTHDGIVHIITGTAGRALDLEPYKKNPWSEFRSIEYGYGRITIYSSKALKYEFLSSSTMEVVDSYLFEK